MLKSSSWSRREITRSTEEGEEPKNIYAIYPWPHGMVLIIDVKAEVFVDTLNINCKLNYVNTDAQHIGAVYHNLRETFSPEDVSVVPPIPPTTSKPDSFPSPTSKTTYYVFDISQHHGNVQT